MIRPTCLVVFALGGLLATGALADDVVFRSDVSLVRVDAQVLDRDNRTIAGLGAGDFILREQGRPQPIRNFASENMPVDVVLLLDVSASMRPHVERIASAAHEALRVLRDQDRVAIMVFDRSTRLRLPFRNSRDAVEREFESLLSQEDFNGGTDITRALLDAAAYIGREGRRDARRAIVILTDDQTERNRDVEGVSRALTRADAVLSALIAPDAMANGGIGGGRRGGTYPGGSPGGTWPGSGPMGGPLGGIILGRRGPGGGRGNGPGMRGSHTRSAGTEEIARRSGGDSMPVDDAYALETTLARIRQRYALHFNLPPDVKPGEERNIEVELAESARRRYPRAEVRYRRVYLAPTGPVVAGDPPVIARAPVNASASESSAPRRRPGVSQDGPRQGPLVGAAAEPAAQSTSQAAPAQEKPQDNKCGWRKVDEPAQPCPADNAPPPAKPNQ